jgi:hypothetical protein
MSERKQTNSATDESNPVGEQLTSKSDAGELSRRNFMGVSSAGLATAALASLAANAQESANIAKGEQDRSVSNPGPENKPLLDENPNSNFPPPTDYGNIVPVWYSFDLPHMRIQEGGWTNQVTQSVLPSSTDIAGVRMRLTAGSFRELHWHTYAKSQRMRSLHSPSLASPLARLRRKEIVVETRNAQLLHAEVKRGSLHSQACGSAVRTRDNPASLHESFENVIAFRVLEGNRS